MTCPKCARLIPDDALLCCYCGRSIVKKEQPKRHGRGNGSGSAYRRGKTWTASYTAGWTRDADGSYKQKRKTKGGFKTRNEALEWIVDVKQGRAKKDAPALARYWETWLAGEYTRLSSSKQTAYKIAWKKLRALQLRPVDGLTVQDLRSAVSEQAPTYYPARDMKTLLGHLFKLAAADGWVSKDLPDFILLPEKTERERTPFTQDEQAALWKLYDQGDRRAALPLVMIYTGMMPGELQGLRVEMVDLDAQQITGAGLKTKVRRASPIYLPDAIVPVLADEIGQRTEGYVWPRNEDKFYESYYAALLAAGCRRLEPYCCRHTTATALAITEGIAPQTVKKIMRWSTTRMLDRYAHPDDAAAQAAINTLQRTPQPSKV